MLPLLAAVTLQQSGLNHKETSLDGLLGKGSLLIRTPSERLAQPKRSPNKGWEFDWSVAGYVGEDTKRMRFELFSQESTQTYVRPENVVRLLLRLCSYNISYMRLDHAPLNRGTLPPSQAVTAYLCFGGDPGGEQVLGVDNQIGGEQVNTIYFYDLQSMTDPVEAAREVAHEYGHAVLPAVGGDYTAPEAWANGYLGEKLYLSYLAQASAEGKLKSDDTLGATAQALRAWVRKNVDPLVDDALTNGPRPVLLARKDKVGMDAFFGLALATARVLTPQIMCRALFVNGTDPKGFTASAATAAEEPEKTSIIVPEAFQGKPIWVPVGTTHTKDPRKELQMRLSNGIVLEARDGWARVKPLAPTHPMVILGVAR